MVHLKIHFSVRAEYKKLGQRKVLLKIQCWHLCTHKTFSHTHTQENVTFSDHTKMTLTYLWNRNGYDYKYLIHNTKVILNLTTVYVVTWLYLGSKYVILLTCYSRDGGPGCFFNKWLSRTITLWSTATWSADTITTAKKQLMTST